MKNGTIENAEKIRRKYVITEKTELEKLIELDKRVSRPAKAFAWSFGSLGAIVFGAGMSLIMTDFGQTIGLSQIMGCGIATGIIGMAICICNYSIYKALLGSRRKKHASEVLSAYEKASKA